MTTTKNNLDPRTWSKRNKIIAAIAASVAVILAIAGIGITVFGSQSHNAKDCTSYQQILTDKTAELDQAIQDAKDALKTVDASLKPGEGTRLAHTDGFPLSSEGQTAINDLSKAISTAKSAKEAEDAKVNDAAANGKKQCSDKQDTTSVDAAIKAIKDQTQSFIDVRDTYRLTKATDEANELMDTAKSNLASAQQSAAEQIAAVEADPNMESDASVKAAYDALKAVETESHTLSTTVTVTTYDEAVASIEKAKTVEKKAAEVTDSVAPLQEAITTYQDAKAGRASNASTTPDTSAPEQGSNNSNTPAPSYGYNGNGGSSNSGSNSPSYSGGSSYTPPAPAPAPNPPANNSGSGDGRIDFGPGQADRPGCVIIEGRSVC